MRHVILLVASILLLASCHQKRQGLTSDTAPSNKSQPTNPISFCGPKKVELNTEPGYDGTLVPLFAGLTENFTYPITTESKIAQKYFDQGLMLSYGFNHGEAARSFREATRQDPNCAMCFWGIGYVLGPNYNAGMEPNALPAAHEAIAQARMHASNCTEKEKALIAALAKRYPKTLDEDAQAYYQAYAKAMVVVQQKFPADQNIAAMAAEALMDLHPWDLWKKDGTAQPWTPEILGIIESVLAQNSKHPQAIHLYIHAMEAGPNPEKVKRFADNLCFLIPGSGHLTHMPSHLYINTGHYHEGTLANERAVKIDSSYVESCHAAGIYPLAYYPHNWHFLAACAALEGKGDRAYKASRYMADHVVEKEMMFVPELAILQHFLSIPWFIQVKFAKWDDILQEPKPQENLIYPTAIWHYARGMALASKGDMAKSQAELEIVKLLGKDESIQDLKLFGINNLTEVVKIAENVLAGEIAYRKGDFETAISLLEKAVEVEDGLAYQEPPDWFFSVRHSLGNVLIRAGKYHEAEQVYRDDLKEWKENGWALIGLHNALVGQDKKEEAAQVKKRFENAWQYADIQLIASVL